MNDGLERLGRLVDAGSGSLAIADDAAVVLAVSGGPDSMALLYGSAHLLVTGRRHWQLSVAHLDHGLRPDSALDAAFVADAASALGVIATTRRVDVAALAQQEGMSIEEAGRTARYRFLEETSPEDALIATAHTADDAAETVILNLLRGAGPTGARGIPARRGRIVRPLLGQRRYMLRAMLDEAGLDYRLDPSNEDAAYLRNRVRSDVIPVLENLRPGAVDRIGRFARLAADDEALLETLARSELDRRSSDGTIDWHDPPAEALGRRVLRLALGDPAPSAERIEALLAAAAGDHGGVKIELGGGRSASVHGRRIRLQVGSGHP